jgi:hypothetical protein
MNLGSHRTSAGRTSLLKWIVFVCIMTAVVETYCYLLFDVLRKLLDDPIRYFFAPMTAVVLVVFAVLYPVMQRKRPLTRILLLYAGFIAANAAYGVYLWSVAAHGTALMVALALVAAHLYGMPLLASIVVADLLLARLLFVKLDRWVAQ